jgi:aspartyl-tRNA(Asn)/glutamyl-tRNA(Gln) amidotransferase subunit B
MAEGVAPRMALHWLSTQLLPAVREREAALDACPVTPARLAGLLRMLAGDEINAKAAREVLGLLFDDDAAPEAIVRRHGFGQVSDTAALEQLIDAVLAAQPAAVADVKSGQGKAMGFLIGQAMQASGGKANPKVIREMLAKKLGANS